MFRLMRHSDPRRAPRPVRAALSALLACALALACAPVPARAADGGRAALADGRAGFGITGFTRYNAGTDRPVDGEDLGYRYPMPEGADVVVAALADGSVAVWVDARAAAGAGLDPADPDDAAALRSLAESLDREVSRGGEELADRTGGWSVTCEPSVSAGGCEVRFDARAGGRSYVSVVPAGLDGGEGASDAARAAGIDLSAAVSFVEAGSLAPASDIAAAGAPSPLEDAASFLSSLDLRPFWVSLRTGAAALAVTFVLGLAAARRVMGTSSRLKGLLDSVFTIPMVLPPTVCGFLLLLLFGQSTPVGRWLAGHGLSVVFSWPAAVISAVVVSFPIMYRTALGAFESLDTEMLDAARTLGWSEGRIFRGLMLPLAWPTIAAGTVLAFARAMGEFGCTLFFAGNYAGVTQTIPIAIYFDWMGGDTRTALFWVVAVIAFSLLVVLGINAFTARSQRYRRGGGRSRRRPGPGEDGPADEPGGDAVRIDRAALFELMGPAPSGDGRGGGEA